MNQIIQKIIYCLLVVFAFPIMVFGQDNSVDPYAEWLVQLVYENYPSLQVMDSEAKAFQEEIKLAKKEWMRAPGFNLGFNRGSNLDDPNMGTGTENFVFPRVSIGASVNLYPILTNKSKVRVAEAAYEAQVYSMDVEKSTLRREVLTRYRDYQLTLELVRVRSKMEEDADAHYRLLDRLFRGNEADFKDYNDAYKTYQGAIEARLQAQADRDKARIALEELLGMSLDDARRLWESRG